jgi:hypothetical protein
MCVLFKKLNCYLVQEIINTVNYSLLKQWFTQLDKHLSVIKDKGQSNIGSNAGIRN